MEPNKQIDYATLEWFDCKNNLPPMRTNLYVDSEHGYGIGRLGKRVIDGSTIWTVYLDSGHVYLVYAFYKVKRWAYIPKDEKTNTKLKHELKTIQGVINGQQFDLYFKDDADKIITELEKQVEMGNNARDRLMEDNKRLNAELAQLKEQLRWREFEKEQL